MLRLVPTPKRNSAALHAALGVVMAAAALLLVITPAFQAPAPFGIAWDGPRIALTDFASHFRFTQAFWSGEALDGASIYSVENHLHVTSEWAGRDSAVALSFGYSPTMLLILGLLVPFSAPLAYGIFNILGVLAAWWQTRPRYSRAGWGLAAFVTPVATGCFLLGQTAILTGAGLLYLFLYSRDEEEGGGRGGPDVRRLAGAVFVLWMLTAKPPLAITAGAACLSLRQWRPVLGAVILAALATAALAPFMGPGWAGDYVEMIRTYNTVEAHPAWAFGFVPEHMANLRGILHVDLAVPDDMASRISSIVWLGSLGLLVGAGRRLRLGTGGTWAAALVLFLLFSPHVSSTEVLQIVLLVPFCVPAKDPIGWRSRVLFLTVPLIPLLSPPFTGVRIPLFSVLAASLVWAVWARLREEESAAGGVAPA